MGMAKGLPMPAAYTFILILAFLQTLQLIEAQIGVCYGKYAGENLPSSQDVVRLYQQNGIKNMRIYDLDQGILQALQGSGIKTIIQVPNDNLQSVGTNYQAAAQFVQTYVAPYASSIKYIAVGNEVVTQRNEYAQYVGPAMQNVLNAINNANLGGYNIKVTTAIGTSMVSNSYPPSNGYFSNTAFMNPVVDFLAANGSPLLLNIYTYFSYDLDLPYRLFTLPGTRFTDPNNGLQYQNLFDALLDATYAALNRAGSAALQSNGHGSGIKIVASESGWKSGFGHPLAGVSNAPGRRPKIVIGQSGWISGSAPPPPAGVTSAPAPHVKIVRSETGWPSHPVPPAGVSNAGENGASQQNAQTYYSNLISHVKGGTPLKRQPIEMYLFEMFDEANKPGEQNFGLFHADQTPKYNLNFN